MVGYDPTTAPRYLGPEEDVGALEARREHVTQRVGEIEAQLQAFNTPGWRFVAADLEDEIARAGDKILRSTMDALQIEHVRGQVRAFDHLLRLPDRLRQELKQLADELHQLSE
jgi:hypothetical protein